MNFHIIAEILCGGTNLGSVAMWKHEENKPTNDDYTRDPEKDWKLQTPTVISGAVKQVNIHFTCHEYSPWVNLSVNFGELELFKFF